MRGIHPEQLMPFSAGAGDLRNGLILLTEFMVVTGLEHFALAHFLWHTNSIASA
jgi:hypothetical protein